MSELIEKYKDHPVHQKIVTFGEALSRLPDSISTDLTNMELFERWKQAHNLINQYLELIDPILAPYPALGNLNSHIDKALNELNAFESDNNPSHLENVNNQIDNAITTLGQFIFPSSLGQIEGLGGAIESFRTAASGYIKNLEEEASKSKSGLQDDFENLKYSFDQLSEQMKGFTANIDSQKSRLDTAISQFQQQFSDAEGKRREEFSEGEAKRSINNSELVQKNENLFKSMLEDKDKKLIDLGEKYAKTMEEAKAELGKVGEQLQKESQKVIDDLSKLKERAESLVHVIGNTGMVGGYQKVANMARQGVLVWHAITVIGMIGLIGFGFLAFTSTLGDGFSWGTFGGRVFVAFTFGVLVTYGARQADKQGEIERVNRKFELELASIDPYLVGLPVEEQNKVKIELAERFFGREEALTQKDSRKTSGTSLDLVKMALEAVLKEQGKK